MPESKEHIVNSAEVTIVKPEQKEPEIIQDTQVRAEVPKDAENWLKKIEMDPLQLKTVTDQNGQPVLQPTGSQNPKVTLPVTRRGFVGGFKKTVNDAGKWLSTFVLRLIKIKKGDVTFPTE